MDDIDSLQPLPPRSDEEACRGLPVKLVAIFAHILGIVNREQAEIKIMRGERAVRGEISADEFARLTREHYERLIHKAEAILDIIGTKPILRWHGDTPRTAPAIWSFEDGSGED